MYKKFSVNFILIMCIFMSMFSYMTFADQVIPGTKFKITYELNSSDAVNSLNNPAEYAFDTGLEKFEAPIISTKDYNEVTPTFEGWYMSPSFQEDTKIESIASDKIGNLTIYAKWSHYKLTINANGGTFDSTDTVNPNFVYIPANQSIINSMNTLEQSEKLILPKRLYHEISSWSINTQGNPILKESDLMEKDTTIKANWIEKNYKLTLSLEGTGIENEDRYKDVYPVTYDVPVNQSIEGKLGFLDKPEKEGCVFKGWLTEDGEKISLMPEHPITLYAHFEPKNYDIIFYANDGSNNYSRKTAKYGEKLSDYLNFEQNELPTRAGYTFEKWTKDKGGSSDILDNDTVKLGGINLYAQWNPIEYTMVLDANGGTAGSIASKLVFYDNKILDLLKNLSDTELPKKDGYTFAKWSTDKAGNNPITDSDFITGNITLYAQYEPIKYPLNIILNGGNFDSEIPEIKAPIEKSIKEILLTIDTPKRKGHNFMYWAKDINGTQIDDNDIMTENGFNVYAYYELANYTLTFDLNGGTGNFAPKLIPYESNILNSITNETAPSKTDYIFNGWSRDKEGSIPLNKDDVMQDSDVTIYAQWKKDTYKVTFNLNGGTGNFAPKSIKVGNVILNDDDVPKRTGYTFKEWSKDKEGSVPLNKNDVMQKSDITIYAQWQVNNYTLTFDSNNGTGNSSTKLIPYGSIILSNITNDNIPKKTGYTFKEWSKDKNTYSPLTQSDVMTENGFTVYAYYTPNQLIAETVRITGKFDTPSEEFLLNVSNGTGNYKYSVSKDSLPKGLSISEDGKITGNFQEAGTFEVSVNVKDINSNVSAIKKVIFDIQKAEPLQVVFPSFDMEDTSISYKYGTPLKDIPLINGKGHGTFVWENPEIIPEIDNSGYTVRFIPSDDPILTLSSESQNFDYPENFEFTKIVQVPITQADVIMETSPFPSSIETGFALSKSIIKDGKMIGFNGEEIKGTYSWKDDTIRFNKEGNYDVIVIFTPENKNYNTLEITTSIYISDDEKSSSWIEPIRYTIKSNSSKGGRISPLGNMELYEFSNQTFTFYPDSGYKVSEVRIDNNKIDLDDIEDNRYTFSGIEESHNIYVEFEKDDGSTSKKSTGGGSKKYSSSTKKDKNENKKTSETKNENKDNSNSESLEKTDVSSVFDVKNHIVYINGYPDGTFKPQGSLTRAEAAAIFSRILLNKAQNKNYSSKFSDVNSNSWYNDCVSFLAEQGIINGYPDGTFRPNAKITRAELVSIVAKALKINKQYTSNFNDINNSWAKDAISAISSFGWIKGYPDGTFKPNSNITRAETTVFLNSVLGKTGSLDTKNIKTFKDVKTSDWFYNDVTKASN